MINWNRPIEVVTDQEILPAFCMGLLDSSEGALVGCSGILLQVSNEGKSLKTGKTVLRNCEGDKNETV
jgi:hypothetical protein